jgi:hypothetical protein
LVSPKRHIVIPDCQVRPDVELSHLTHIGNYIAAKHPDVVVNLGDFADMPSLSSYDVGKASAEGKRYAADIAATKRGMDLLMAPIRAERTKTHRKWKPELVLTLGNHEDRIAREANVNPRLKGTISVQDLEYEKQGWEVCPFLGVRVLDRIEYSHYFVSGAMGRPVSSAAALLRQRQCSAIMGHVQRIDMAVHPNTQYVSLFAGIAYSHDEPYLTPQGQNTKRGIWVLNEIRNGTFDPMFVSLEFLKRRYS